jgi:hypothetical protein
MQTVVEGIAFDAAKGAPISEWLSVVRRSPGSLT